MKRYTLYLLLRRMENNVYRNNILGNILFLVTLTESCKPSYKLSTTFIFYQIQTKIRKYR